MNCISITNISKAFQDKKVLQDVNLKIKYGSFVCIMGNSGCGKTTLINIILGFEQADSGSVTGMPEISSAVFQENRLCEDFSAISNVAMVSNKSNARRDATCMLQALGLGDSINKPVKELSGGMMRRVAIARALMADSHFVIMDEPFKGLDDETKDAVIAYVRRMLQGKTVLLVTHNSDEAKKLGAIVYHMDNYGQLTRID